LEEADALCDRIAVMDKGKVMALGSPEELKAKYEAKTLDEAFLKITGHILWSPEA
jgi:ABC-2 type transport system ATP-binding protein